MLKLNSFLIKKGIHYLFVRFGTKKLKQMAFDAKYTIGGWGNFHDNISEEFVRKIETYCHGGNICVVGCGTGGIVTKLSPMSYNSFVGIDLSIEAIKVAKQLSNEKISFAVADMLTYEPLMKLTVVCFEECLYYLNVSSRKKAIEKYLKYLTKDGVIIITISQSQRYKSIFIMLRKNFKVLEDRKFQNSNRHLVVLGNQ